MPDPHSHLNERLASDMAYRIIYRVQDCPSPSFSLESSGYFYSSLTKIILASPVMEKLAWPSSNTTAQTYMLLSSLNKFAYIAKSNYFEFLSSNVRFTCLRKVFISIIYMNILKRWFFYIGC